jgi:hypothetical protein
MEEERRIVEYIQIFTINILRKNAILSADPSPQSIRSYCY